MTASPIRCRARPAASPGSSTAGATSVSTASSRTVSTDQGEGDGRETAMLRAGVAQRVITPAGSWPMDGYILRDGPSCGVLDDLLAQVLFLDDDQTRAVLVTLDLVGVDAAFTARLRAAVEERYRVPGHHVLVTASHTHSGPSGFVSLWDPAAVESPLREQVIQRVLEAVGEAGESAVGTQWQVCRAAVKGVGTDRNDPGGRPSDVADALLLWRQDGSLAAVVVHYACHPTVLGPGNRLLSTDFVGPMRRVLAAALAEAGYGAPAVLFVNGAAADVSTRFTRRNQSPGEARRLGALLAAQLLGEVLAARPEDAVAPGPIRALEQTVEVPGRGTGAADTRADGDGLDPAVPDGAEARAELEAARSGGDPHQLRIQRARLEGLLARRWWPSSDPTVCVRLQALAVGDVAWLAVPGELDRELAEAIRAASPLPYTLLAGYANDYVGYILGRRLATAGTYESLVSRLAPGAGEAVRDAAVELLCRFAGWPEDATVET